MNSMNSMNAWIQSILVLLILTDLVMLGSSRVWKCIRIVAAQGLLLGLMLLFVHADGLSLHVMLLALASVLAKALLFPWILIRMLRKTDVNSDVEPFIGYGPSMLIGTLLLPLSLWLASRLPLPGPVVSPLSIPVALFTMLVGFFLLVSRKKAITQVLGYLLLENGIYAFGLALVIEVPLLIEFGMLLDLVGAAFVMGLALFNINQSFDHIDTSRLSALKE